MHIDLVTPSGEVFSGEIDEIAVPGAMGEMGLLPGHIPVITALDIGELIIYQGNQSHHFFVEGGFLEIARDRINVITETALKPEEIDVAEAQTMLQQAENALKDGSDEGPAQSQAKLHNLKRAETMIRVGSHR